MSWSPEMNFRLRMTNGSIQDLYTRSASLYEMLFIRISRYDAGLRSFFLSNSYLRSQMKILDAGCGSGLVTRTIQKVAATQGLDDITFHGFDITNAMLELFRKHIENLDSTIELRQADAMRLESSLPTHWNQYDLIVSSAMLEYIPKKKLVDVLKSLKALLKPNGKILIFITRKNLLMKWLIQKPWRANIYALDEIQDVFSKTGFTDVTFKKFVFPYNYINWWGFIVEAKATLDPGE